MPQNFAGFLGFNRYWVLYTSRPSACRPGAVLNPNVEIHASELPGNLRACNILARLRWSSLRLTLRGLAGFRFKLPMMARHYQVGFGSGTDAWSFTSAQVSRSRFPLLKFRTSEQTQNRADA